MTGLSWNGLWGSVLEIGAQQWNLEVCNHSKSDRNGLRILTNPLNDAKIVKTKNLLTLDSASVLSCNGLSGVR